MAQCVGVNAHVGFVSYLKLIKDCRSSSFPEERSCGRKTWILSATEDISTAYLHNREIKMSCNSSFFFHFQELISRTCDLGDTRQGRATYPNSNSSKIMRTTSLKSRLCSRS